MQGGTRWRRSHSAGSPSASATPPPSTMSRSRSRTASSCACSAPPGCGKTTALRLVAGFIEPTAGEIALGDRVVSSPERTLPPERRNVSMVFQSYALWPHMTVAAERRLRPEDAQARPRRHRQEGRRAPGHDAARRAGRALPGRAVRRPAAARVARPRPDRRARDAAARRAAVQPRRQPARGDALRGAPPARRLPLHDHLRHPRPERGDDHGRPDRRHECAAASSSWARRRRSTTSRAPSSSPASSAAATSSAARRSTPRASRSPAPPSHAAARPLAPVPTCAVSIRQHDIRIARRRPATADGNAVQGTVVRNVFLGAARDYIVEVKDGTPAAHHRRRRRTISPPGSAVLAEAAAERCRALVG